MRRILFLLILGLLWSPALTRGQESAAAAAARQEMEENYKSLRGAVEDLKESRVAQDKAMEGIQRELAVLRDRVSKPAGNFATPEDVKRLADAIAEVDRKRVADMEHMQNHISTEIAKLARLFEEASRARPTPPTRQIEAPAPPPPQEPTPQAPERSDETALYYKIKKGDYLSAIVQAYREKGYKVTLKQIKEANPSVDPNNLQVGKKIRIPIGTDGVKDGKKD